MTSLHKERSGYKIFSDYITEALLLQCPPLNRITLGQHKSDKNNRMIKLTDVFCVLFRYITGSLLSDCNKWLIQLTVIQLSGGHCRMLVDEWGDVPNCVTSFTDNPLTSKFHFFSRFGSSHQRVTSWVTDTLVRSRTHFWSERSSLIRREPLSPSRHTTQTKFRSL